MNLCLDKRLIVIKFKTTSAPFFEGHSKGEVVPVL